MNGTLPENMKISKLLLFKERHNFAQKKMCCPQKQKSNGPFIFAACIALRRIGSTLQGLLGQLFTNIYFFRQINSHVKTLQRYFVLGWHHTCTLEGFFLMTLNLRIKKKKIPLSDYFVFIPDLVDLSFMLGNGTLGKPIFQELLLTSTSLQNLQNIFRLQNPLR